MGKTKPIRLDLATMPTALPIESIQVLVSKEQNDKFKVISKKILSDKVKLTLKHKSSRETVKLEIPIDYLEMNKIFYKEPVIPTTKLVEGVLEEKVRGWTCEYIVTDIAEHFDLVVVRCKESNKLIALKIAKQDIENTKLYIDKSTSYKAIQVNLDRISIWKESEWQREIQTKVSLSKLASNGTVNFAQQMQ